MITKYSNRSSLVQIVLVISSIAALNHAHTSVAILLMLAASYIGGRNLAAVRAMQAKSRQQLEDKLYAREFYPMPSPEEDAEIQRIKRVLKMYQPLRFFNKKSISK